MDPAVGRRWVSGARLLEEVYLHTQRVPAASWRDWAGSPDFLRPLAARLARLGIGRAGAALIDAATADPGWPSLARLDAAARLVAALVRAGGLRRGREARRVARRAARPEPAGTIPDGFWSVRPAPPAPDEDGGAPALPGGRPGPGVGPRSATDEAAPRPAAGLGPELAAALADPSVRTGRTLLGLLGGERRPARLALAAGLVLAAAGAVFEALLLRGVIDVGRSLRLVEQRLAAVAAFCWRSWPSCCSIEFRTAGALARLGRRLEVGLRLRFLEAIPRLHDRYFQSRPISDMAERGHGLHQVRLFPRLAGQFARAAIALGITAAAISLADPAGGPTAIAAAVLALGAAGRAAAAAPGARPPRADPRRRPGPLLPRCAPGAHGGARPRRGRPGPASRARGPAGRMGAGQPAAPALGRDPRRGAGVRRLRPGRLAPVPARRARGPSPPGCCCSPTGRSTSRSWAGSSRPWPGNTRCIATWSCGCWSRSTRRSRSRPGPRRRTPPRPDLRGARRALGRRGHRVRVGGRPRRPGRPSSKGSRPASRRGATWRSSALRGRGSRAWSGSCSAGTGRRRPGPRRRRAARRGAARSPAGRDGLDRPRGPALEPLPARRTSSTGTTPATPPRWARSSARPTCWGSSQQLPDGLQTSLGEGGGRLSGGEGQRVRLGRALIRPGVRLVILDEPFRGLDRDAAPQAAEPGPAVLARRHLALHHPRHRPRRATSTACW